MDVRAWVAGRGGVVHRSDVLERGVSERELRTALRDGTVCRIRRYWVATPDAPPLLVAAADATARLTCVSAARHRGWWMPPTADERLHLHHDPHAAARPGYMVRHWSAAIGVVSARSLLASVEDTLQHIAECQPRETALVLWEDAVHSERMSAAALRRVAWASPAARTVAAMVTGEMDSGLETMFLDRLRHWNVSVRVQVRLAGHDVDAVIDDWLVVQLDGFSFHSSSADRTRDLAHDRELTARGYTVLRFSYAEVVHRWDTVEHALARALAQHARR